MNERTRDKYTVVIGLEIHAQLSTASKIYSSDSTKFGQAPNTNVSVITLGHPGTMPKLNKKVIEYAIKMGLACHCHISRYLIFCRKNYFYPDLPKGFQLTQDKTPVCTGGFISIGVGGGEEKRIRLNRIHVEEDAGKSIHLPEETDTLVDLNRAGVPLIEIVTEPDLRTSDEAYVLLFEIRKMVRYLDICDGNMEEGSLRCDANVSVMLREADQFGQKVELKNMNSIRNVKNAIDHEVERQIDLLEKGLKITSETRTYNAETGTSQGMRVKEELNDYRYFPEPDLSPVFITDFWVNEIAEAMPVLPGEVFIKFTGEYQLPQYDAQVLTENKYTALFFEHVCQHTQNFRAVSNWIMGPLKATMNEHGISISSVDDLGIAPENLATIINMIDDGYLNFTIASQQLLPALLEDPSLIPMELASKMNLLQQSDTKTLKPLIDEIYAQNPDQIKAYRNGKKGLLGMFMGELMKKTNGRADPKLANKLWREVLDI